jgi:hypothetical protein
MNKGYEEKNNEFAKLHIATTKNLPNHKLPIHLLAHSFGPFFFNFSFS